MGFPVITVEKIATSNMYTISQEYFLSDPDSTPVQTVGSMEYGYSFPGINFLTAESEYYYIH